MFIDIAKIRITAGDGGNGKVSFHREKYVAAGGPDGGDGGRGGDVIVKVDDNMSTLLDFKYKKKYEAGRGEDGKSAKSSGKDGQSLTIRVPRGTLIKDAESGKIIKDMSDSDAFVAAKGGRGGWGNQHFATPTRQTPRFAKNGTPGESREIILELKLIADVGLIGFPNVGKSTLLSMVSSARPKIANYHFTTLVPNLGVVRVDEGESFVMADIPGLIEGAAEGVGLGHEFLRHVERCRLIVHVIDVSGSEGRDPTEDFHKINEELSKYSRALFQRPQIVAANKTDILENRDLAESLKSAAAEKGFEYMEISAATRQNVDKLMYRIWEKLKDLPPVTVYEPEYVENEVSEDDIRETKIRVEDGVYIVEGAWIERLLGSVNLADYESRMYFHRVLQKAGVFDRLEEMGIEEHDTVSIYDLEFEYVY